MKKLIVLIAIGLFAENMIAQGGPVAPATLPAPPAKAHTRAIVPPQAVIDSFDARFPRTRVKKWQQRREGYVAILRMNGKRTNVDYAPDGSWQATETEVKWSWRLPHAVRQGWRHSDFAAWYILKMAKMVTPDQVYYAMDVSNWPLLDAEHMFNFDEEYVIYFTADGKLTKKNRK